MTYNEKMIRQYVGEYREIYINKFLIYPNSWFSYLKSLSECVPTAHNFTMEEIDVAKEVLGCEDSK